MYVTQQRSARTKRVQQVHLKLAVSGGPLESMRPTRKLCMVGCLAVRVKVASASCLLQTKCLVLLPRAVHCLPCFRCSPTKIRLAV
jgi:hypothetical protein